VGTKNRHSPTWAAKEIPVEFVKAQITMTETGYPVHISIAQDAYGDACRPAPEEGWFWVPCTVQAAKDIRRRGLRAVGTITTTFIPAQEPVVLRPTQPEQVPVSGSQEHTELMLEENS
jgi:hypothetical protein